MSERSKPPSRLSRRRFVAVIAAGSAGLLARPVAAVAAATPPAKAKPAAPAAGPKPAAPAMSAAQRKEYERQRAATADTLKTIRAHVMPPGTEMASVFRARRPAKKGR